MSTRTSSGHSTYGPESRRSVVELGPPGLYGLVPGFGTLENWFLCLCRSRQRCREASVDLAESGSDVRARQAPASSPLRPRPHHVPSPPTAWHQLAASPGPPPPVRRPPHGCRRHPNRRRPRGWPSVESLLAVIPADSPPAARARSPAPVRRELPRCRRHRDRSCLPAEGSDRWPGSATVRRR
jgi:hypothetical protein